MTGQETLEPRQVQECLETTRRSKGASPFYDIHVHPFDVIFQSLRYQRTPDQPGVFGVDTSRFTPPSVGPVSLGRSSQPPASYRSAFFLVVVRSLYRHVGPQVLAEQMALGAIDRMLLLPVASATDSDDWQNNALLEMFADDPRFLLAVSIPNPVPDREIAGFISRAAVNRRARAVKLHPAITGIDLGSVPGRERLEAVLDGCRTSGLPLLIHGGRSYPILDKQAESYACIRNLARIPWGDARVPVCIAHAGCFASGPDEIEKEILPTLHSMLATHPNLFVDVSALECDALALVLKQVDTSRVLFGSDALYQPSWVAMVKLISTLERNRMDAEASVAQIAGLNPSRFLSTEGETR